MKTPLQLLLAASCLMLVSCMDMYSSETPTAYGTAKKQFYAQVGMDNDGVEMPQGGGVQKAYGRESWRDTMVMAGVVLPASYAAKTEQVTATATAATQQTALKTAAKVETTAIEQIGTTARSVGNNPEANPRAINAVGNLFKR